MAEHETVRVQPEAMRVASQALSSAAKDLHTRLVELDGQVRDLLTGWRGGSGGAYGEAWDSWHRGAAGAVRAVDHGRGRGSSRRRIRHP
jgi:WXG100 family type VII secretion target